MYMPRGENSSSVGSEIVPETESGGTFHNAASFLRSGYRAPSHAFQAASSIGSPLGRVCHRCLEKLGSLMRSQARNGTSWKRETTAEIKVCWRRTASGSRKAFSPPRTSGKNAKKLNCTGSPYFRAVIK